MKKRFLPLLLPLLLLPLCRLPVFAEVAAETGADKLWSVLPAETVDLLRDLGIETVDHNAAGKLDVLSFLSALRPSFTRALKLPLKTGGILLSMLLCCLLASHLTGEEKLIGKTGTALCALLTLSPLADVMTRYVSTVKTTAAFLQGYVPICAGLTVACGRPAGAAASQAFLLSFCAILQTAANRLVLPLSGMLFALAAVTSTEASPASAFADLLFKAISWGLGILATLAGGMFALQTGIAASSDSLSLRSAKFAVSGFVPVVGGVLSEALGTVTASAAVIRSGVGIVVLLALLMLFLPPLLELACWQITLKLLAFFAGSCGEGNTERLFKRTASVFSVLTAALCAAGALLLFATAILIKTGG